MYNGILRGKQIPPSFLSGIIIPLRKNDDSANAMDYRPITLLPTSYKIFAKILEERVQEGLDRNIGETQRGFVKGRLMERLVVCMQAIMQLACSDGKEAIDKSALVVLLDFLKAYDMLNRHFLFQVLRKFGFNEEFVDLIERLHDETTVQFLANEGFSDTKQVVSGIRQGCPLAPLLFISAAETLALAVTQNEKIRGITLPGTSTEPHKIADFVDDSAIFLRHVKD